MRNSSPKERDSTRHSDRSKSTLHSRMSRHDKHTSKLVEYPRSKSPIGAKYTMEKEWTREDTPLAMTRINMQKLKNSTNARKNPRLVKDEGQYHLLAEAFRLQLESMIIKSPIGFIRKLFVNNKVLSAGDLSNKIKDHEKELLKQFVQWDFSTYEKKLLAMCLHQLLTFINVLRIEKPTALETCHTLQDILVLYYVNSIASGQKMCDINFLFYLCNFVMNANSYQENQKYVLDKGDFKFSETVSGYTDDFVIYVRSKKYDELSKSMSVVPTRYLKIEDIQFADFNEAHRKRMFHAQRSFAYLDPEDLQDSDFAVIRKQVQQYFICPRDLSFVTNPFEWLEKHKTSRIVDAAIISDKMTPAELGLLPYHSLNDVLLCLFWDIGSVEHYKIMETRDYNQSYLNFPKLTIRPVVYAEEFANTQLAQYTENMIIPIEYLLKLPRDDVFLMFIMEQKPNFGTDLWLSFGVEKEIHLLIHFGYYKEWISDYMKKNGKEEEQIPVYMRHMARVIARKSDAEFMNALRANLGLKGIIYVSDIDLFMCNISAHFDFINCAFTSFKVYGPVS